MASSKRLFTLTNPHGQGGVFFAWQRTSGGFLATTGYDQLVAIYNRHAEIVDQIRLPGMCCCFGWDKDGDCLAVITDKSSDLLIWDANSQRSQWLDTGIRDPLNVLVWAKSGPTLAIGSYRGNLMLYNHKTSRRIPVIGKHSKAITCGAWSEANLLALGSEDRTLSISNSDGDTIRVATLRAEPSNIQFSEMKQDERRSAAVISSSNSATGSSAIAGSSGNENTVSLIVGGKTLYLFNLYDPENPIELAFQSRYGSIIAYNWFGDGYILIGFSQGFFVVISTHMKEIGQELFQVKNHKDSLSGIAISENIEKAASCGDNTVKIHELHDLKDTANVITLDDERGLDQMEWSEDGQLLAVSTTKGNLHVYLSSLPLLGSAHQSRVAYLTSLLEVTVTSALEGTGSTTSTTIAAEVEPGFMALGPFHLALGMNNRAWFYAMGDAGSVELIRDREYLGTVQGIFLNADYCAVRFDGKIQLHVLEGEGGGGGDGDQVGPAVAEDRESKMFPEPSGARGTQDVITCHTLTTDFLVYGSDMGAITFFLLEDWCIISEFRHSAGIKDLVADPNGTKVVMIDVKSNGYIFNPINDELTTIRGFPENAVIKKILWDNSVTDRDIFVAYDQSEGFIYTFLVKPDDVEEGGTSCVCLGKTKIPSGQYPVLVFGGEVSLQTQSGKLVRITLSTHEISPNVHEYTNQELKDVINKNISLGRFRNAWAICQILGDHETWIDLGKAALKQLEIDFSSRVFRHIGDVGMVWSLDELKSIEDRKLMSGHVALILSDHNLAQTLYLQSSSPIEALNMRRDLLQWDQALHLANKLAPEEIPYISKEYAQQLEFTGAYADALVHYEKGALKDATTGEILTKLGTKSTNIGPTEAQQKLSDKEDEHNRFCLAGIARTSLRCGQLRRGLDICTGKALRGNKALQRECAEILEQMKQLSEAATLYEQANYFDKAAYLYIKLKDWTKIGKLLPHISSPKIQLAYARAKEADNRFAEAVVAYESARDYDNAVRVYLDHLNDPESAVKIVKTTHSTEGAKLVARFFLKLGDFSSAIRFLVMSRCVDEAFQLAKQHGKMNLFAEIIDGQGDVDDKLATQEDYRSIALYFESERNSLQAGRFFYKAGEHSKALRQLLKAAASSNNAPSSSDGNGRLSSIGMAADSEALNLAIEVVGSSGQGHLSRQLIDYLMGETDGIPKDAKYLFRLYMARNQYKEAAKTAIIIAREEQAQGNYRNAHDVLFNMYQELIENHMSVPAEMRTNLMLLHSYVLARLHVKKLDHMKAARMLLRVAKNISRFPAHVVPILTSTIIECHRSGLKQSAFSYAVVLMRPEHRPNIDDKYRKKIEGIVRKPPQRQNNGENGNLEEPPKLTPCPYCSEDVLESELYCGHCKSTLPYCVVTGYHIISTDLTVCQSCFFPGFRSEMLRLAQGNDGKGEPCPMCGELLEANALKPMNPSQLVGFSGGRGDTESSDLVDEDDDDQESRVDSINDEDTKDSLRSGKNGLVNGSRDYQVMANESGGRKNSGLYNNEDDTPHPLSANSSSSDGTGHNGRIPARPLMTR